MKTIFAIVIIAGCYLSSFAQKKEIASFKTSDIRFESAPGKESEQEIFITFSNLKDFLGYKVSYDIDAKKTTLPLNSIFLPASKTYTVKDSVTQVSFKIRFNQDSLDDKTIVLKLSALGKDDKPTDATLKTSELNILVKPKKVLSSDGTLWFYTGTNIDVFDGPKGLYFKTSFLKKFTKSPKHWIYVNLIKNRYSSGTDSISRRSYSDIDINKNHPDSIYQTSGFYDSMYEQTSDNLSLSISYLYQIINEEDDELKVFASPSFSFGHQRIKTTYTNKILTSKTTGHPSDARLIGLSPLFVNNTRNQYDINLSAGFMIKNTTDKWDIRADLYGGYSRLFYPFGSVRQNGAPNAIIYAPKNATFLQARFESTLLSLGLSFGFDGTFRSNELPLFNVYFSKVFDINGIGSLFSKIAPNP